MENKIQSVKHKQIKLILCILLRRASFDPLISVIIKRLFDELLGSVLPPYVAFWVGFWVSG